MKVREVIKSLMEYHDLEQEICASWWDRDLFASSYKDLHGVEMSDEVWDNAVWHFDQQEGYDFINSNMFDLIHDNLDAPEEATA